MRDAVVPEPGLRGESAKLVHRGFKSHLRLHEENRQDLRNLGEPDGRQATYDTGRYLTSSVRALKSRLKNNVLHPWHTFRGSVMAALDALNVAAGVRVLPPEQRLNLERLS